MVGTRDIVNMDLSQLLTPKYVAADYRFESTSAIKSFGDVE